MNYPIGNITGIGFLGQGIDSGKFSLLVFVTALSNIIGVLTVVGGIWFIFQIIIASFNWITAGSDKQSLQNAKKRLSNAIIGLFLVVISYSMVILIASFFGLDILNLYATVNKIVPN